MKNKLNYYLFCFFLMPIYTLQAQVYEQDSLVELIEATYKNYKERQVYDSIYRLKISKDLKINYTSVDWLVIKHSGVKPATILNLNNELSENRKSMPSYSRQKSTYTYEIENYKKKLLHRTFEIVDGNDISIENAKILQKYLPNSHFKKFKWRIRMGQHIDLNEGLIAKEGPIVDFCEINPFRNFSMYNAVSKPKYLKNTKKYKYSFHSSWEEDGEEYLKVNFEPYHSKQTYEGYLVINITQLAFMEVYAQQTHEEKTDSVIFSTGAKDIYHSKYKAHTNGQILPYFVEITNYCDCTNPYNGFTKFVSMPSKEEESKVKFKLKGKEEYESVKTYHYQLEYL